MTRPAPVVGTTSGAVRGVWRETSAAFLGIPFAAPPVGPRRFGAPERPEAWDGVREATAFGATAQRGDPGATLIPEPSIPGEATLNVNVYSPDPSTDAGLPVLVYIHGGGFVGGSPASPWYDGAAFARDGVVTVVISYRLGFDGFGWIDDGVNNRALLDWLAALAWVQENIAGFGGDPGQVTVAGQSAGAAAALSLVTMPRAVGLFQRAWAMSPPVSGLSAASAQARSRRLARSGGIPPTRAGFASLPEGRVHALQEGLSSRRQNRLAQIRGTLHSGMPWGPVVDGDLLPSAPPAAMAAGAGRGIALVVGATDDEFTMVTDDAGALRRVPPGAVLGLLGLRRAARRAYLAANASQARLGTAALVGRFVTDSVFRTTVARTADARAATDAPTWVYRFAWPSPTRRWALHCLDVPFWFDCLDEPHVSALAGDEAPVQLAHDLHGAAVRFIRSSDPGWSPWTRGAPATRVFDAPESGLEDDGYRSVRALL